MKKLLSRGLPLIIAAVICVSLLPVTAGALREPESAPNIDSASGWAQESINSAFSKGFIPVDLQGDYTSIITRQEFCRMAVKWVEYATGTSIDNLLRAKGLTRDPGAFSDTNDPDILAAFALGITNGTGNGRFTPNGAFSRQQAATMIMNTCRAIGADVSHPAPSGFADLGSAAAWAVDGINFVRANGIMQGTGSNNFSPNAAYTREQSIITFDNTKHTVLPGLNGPDTTPTPESTPNPRPTPPPPRVWPPVPNAATIYESFTIQIGDDMTINRLYEYLFFKGSKGKNSGLDKIGYTTFNMTTGTDMTGTAVYVRGHQVGTGDFIDFVIGDDVVYRATFTVNNDPLQLTLTLKVGESVHPGSVVDLSGGAYGYSLLNGPSYGDAHGTVSGVAAYSYQAGRITGLAPGTTVFEYLRGNGRRIDLTVTVVE